MTTSQTIPKRPFAAQVYREGEVESSAISELRGELRGEIRTLRNSLARVGSTRELSAQLELLHKTMLELVPEPPKQRGVSALLDRVGVEGRAASLMRAAIAKAKSKVKSSDEATLLEDAWREALWQMVRVASWPLAHKERAIVALVGPSGVGKTTTSAKLAARAITMGRTATLVACDHFRVGGAHQLERFAELMGADYASASSPADLIRVVAGSTSDIVIVDTAGVVPTEGGIEASVTRASNGRTVSTLLCMPAAVRASDAKRIAEVFAPASPSALCITKIDETDAPGGLLHAMVASRLPISTLCNGPRVPDDIAPASSAAVIDALSIRRES
jgi:flagellar biosynthesis protein FlhF